MAVRGWVIEGLCKLGFIGREDIDNMILVPISLQ